jgi:U3 small nucleolar RNA-associated protein 21
MVAQPTEVVQDQGPPRKRPRHCSQDASPQTAQKRPREPRLFAPFRALGLVTNHVPFVFEARSFKGATDGPKVHLVTCLGKSWAMWEGEKMNLLLVGKSLSMNYSRASLSLELSGPDAADHISSLAMESGAVWAAAGPAAIKYVRGKEVCLGNICHYFAQYDRVHPGRSRY